ncbi:MerR family DNA-binding protein [Ideonella oryzae]|uniref:MerR family DNA-binding protein n=1 Tax=Ideonella oryzae TaxID=2937441 RepID=UPI002110E825|nr:MerR family DNA-binding protein [Ideonella oryzae]
MATSRIRFYERVGLLKQVERQPNGYRSYPADAVLVLQLISAAQRAGFSLDELRVMLPDDEMHWDQAALLDTLRRKVQDIEALQGQLVQSRAQLLALVAQIEAKPEDMDCASNARRLMADMTPAPARSST